MKMCNTCCLLENGSDAFESNRTTCKTCRQKVDPSTIPKPTECMTCGRGQPDVDFAFRNDLVRGGWRKECNVCYNGNKHSQKSRANRRAEDEAGYLARNAASHLDWARRNREKVREQQLKGATDATRKIMSVRTSARARGVAFNDDEADVMAAKLASNCHYCDFRPFNGGVLNGLDRLDSDSGYNDINTVSCCVTCNSVKGPRSVDAFIANVRNIFAHRKFLLDGAATADPRADLDLDSLTMDAKISLWSSPCYMCGMSPALGIDNSAPCCADCHNAKKDISIADFEMHIRVVHMHTSRWTLKDVDNMPRVTVGGNERRSVRASHKEGLSMIFPSIACASMIIGANMSAIHKAVDNASASCMGCKWVSVEAREYLGQRVSTSEARQIIQCIRASGKRNVKKN